MATVEGTKYPGPVLIDLSDIKDELIDLAPGAMRGLRGEQEGMPEVVQEIMASTPEQRNTANIPDHVYQRVITGTVAIGKLRNHEAALKKALEVCIETRAKKENDREDDLGIMAKAAREAADKKKAAAIAAPFERMIKYNGQIAAKAVYTRKKNAEAKEAEDGAAEPDAGQTPPA